MEGPLLKNKIEQFVFLASCEARLVVIFAGILFLSFVDLASFNLPNICLWEKIFGYCPAKGTMRALSAFLHGRFYDAFSYNLNVIIIIPVIAGTIIKDLIKLIKKGLVKS